MKREAVYVHRVKIGDKTSRKIFGECDAKTRRRPTGTGRLVSFSQAGAIVPKGVETNA